MSSLRWLAAFTLLACGARTELDASDAGSETQPAPAIRQLALGNEHSCLLVGSEVYCWGTNSHGELGNGTTTSSAVPLLVAGVGPAQQIASGDAFDVTCPTTTPARGSHTCAVLTDSTVTCWGANIAGEWNDTPPAVAVATLAATPKGLANVTSLGIGGFQNCVVDSNAAISCWGVDALGDGSLYSLPSGPVRVGGINDATKVAIGDDAVCALRSDETVWCWGDDSIGQLGDGHDGFGAQSSTPVQAQIDRVVQLSGGWGEFCATRDNGQALCWGYNESGQIGNGTVSHDIATPTVVPLPNVKQVTTSGSHACAVLVDGTVWCWGNGLDGRLGIDATPDAQPNPTKVDLDGVVEIASGWHHTCALRTDGSVWCWGRNDAGEVGDGTMAERDTPTHVLGLP
jgi:alpha-tubulin suppressor-like RCC1 family protein